MSGGGIARGTGLAIYPQVGRRNELSEQFAGECAAETPQHFGRIVRVAVNRMHGDLDHGGNQRGGHAVSADICHQKTNLVLVDGNKCVEVAGYGGHGQIRGGYAQVGDLWNAWLGRIENCNWRAISSSLSIESKRRSLLMIISTAT